MSQSLKLDRFKDYVLSKYQIYNSLFLTLPFDKIRNTAMHLPLFANSCKNGYSEQWNPEQIVEDFFKRYVPEFSEKERYDLLFRFIQYIERQIVLFDAIEDAAFNQIHNRSGRGTVRYLKEEIFDLNKTNELKQFLKQYNIRIVLTAHPTQFYPDVVLVLINDLSDAIKNNDLPQIQESLTQLGKTPFFKKTKPTPYEEALSLIWYLENVFYKAASSICYYLSTHIYQKEQLENPIFDFGFWPGGDRDGNPYVTPDTTLKTAQRLKLSILRRYYNDILNLKKRITFPIVDKKIQRLESKLFSLLFSSSSKIEFTAEGFIKELKSIAKVINQKHQGLYFDQVTDLIHKVKLFGLHFASLDIRQDSRVHFQVFQNIISHPDSNKYLSEIPQDYSTLSTVQRCVFLSKLSGDVPPSIFSDEITKQTLESIRLIRKIQLTNGERACNRYIISNTQSIENILQLFAMFRISGWDNPTVDIIPLFETIDDLSSSVAVMDDLYSNQQYMSHLERRHKHQTIMLGFSDGTKDGGYLMANWKIYRAKEDLSRLSDRYGIRVTFFDGRGGPPARGGGNTHQFYASRGNTIISDSIQLTIQGQTISSNFGTVDSARFNFEQLLSAGIRSRIVLNDENTILKQDRETFEKLAELSYGKYSEFKQHPKFIPYLELMSTLPYYSKTNIGSRPAKRGTSNKLVFSDLRAIPFVGSWSLLKQNVPGFYGVGHAIQEFEKNGEFHRVKDLFDNSRFFRTLIFNSMMSLTKSFFGLTAYMGEDDEFGEFWQIIYDEYKLTKKLLLKLTDFKTLMEYEPTGKASIMMRDEIVQPLLTIQQYALKKVREVRKEVDSDNKTKKLQILEKLIVRSLFGNINASRNSA